MKLLKQPAHQMIYPNPMTNQTFRGNDAIKEMRKYLSAKKINTSNIIRDAIRERYIKEKFGLNS